MNYPFPEKVSGPKRELIRAYKQVINKNKNKNLPDLENKNLFRICVYNVYQFRFLYNSNKNIYDFIAEIQPDYISLIEYNNYPLDEIFYKLNFNTNFLEQLHDYGILTLTPHKANINCRKYMSSNSLGEKSGFTHTLIYNINIITVHLDVFDESGITRLYEIMEVHEYVVTNRLENVVIIGDYNEMDIDDTHPLYLKYLQEFQERTNLPKMSTRVHNILKQLNYVNIYELFESDEVPKFSCWSGKLVDYCYIWKPTWNKDYIIYDINMPMVPYSDHLPLVLDIKLPDNLKASL